MTELLPEPIEPDGSVFGNVIDDHTVEVWLGNTLRRWLPAHLHHQEQRWQLPAGTIDPPASWPAVSQFRIDLEDHLPAVVIAYNGTVPNSTRRMRGGGYRQAFSYDITCAVAGIDEDDARATASRYLAAVKSALDQNHTLDGRAETTVLVGPDAPAAGQGVNAAGDTVGERALYRTTVHVYVRDTVNKRLGPVTPPDDPFDPPPFPPPAEEAEVLIETDLEETP